MAQAGGKLMARTTLEYNVSAEIDSVQMLALVQHMEGVKMGAEKVITRAINKIAVKARTRLLDMIVKEVNLTKTFLRDRRVILKRATWTKLFATISVVGKRIPLTQFGARQTAKGVSYAITRGQRKTIKSAFIQTTKKGSKHVFYRSGEPRLSRILAKKNMKNVGARKGMAWIVVPRKPITPMFGPSVPVLVMNAQQFASGQFEALCREQLTKEVDVQLGLMLEKAPVDGGNE